MCFFPCVSPLLLTRTLTYGVSGHQMHGGFSLSKQFSDTSWMSCNLNQSCHYLPGDNIRSHSLKAQFHTTATPLHMPIPSSKSLSDLQLLSTLATCWSFPYSSPLDLIHLLECLTELWETFTYIYWFIIERYDKGYRWISRCKSCVEGLWEGVLSSNALSRNTTLLASSHVHSPRSSQNLVFGGIFGSFIM